MKVNVVIYSTRPTFTSAFNLYYTPPIQTSNVQQQQQAKLKRNSILFQIYYCYYRFMIS